MNQPNAWQRRYQKLGFLGVPDEVIITLGRGVEGDRLSAFDKAELNAGIPDINAIIVTSFVPPGAKLVDPEGSKAYLQKHPVVPGSLVPAALKSYSSTRKRQENAGIKGDKIFATIGLVLPKDKDIFPGIMMEYAGPQEPGEPATRSEVEKYCIGMCQRVAELRKEQGFQPDGPPRVWVIEQQLPEDNQWACVLVAGLYVKGSLY